MLTLQFSVVKLSSSDSDSDGDDTDNNEDDLDPSGNPVRSLIGYSGVAM